MALVTKAKRMPVFYLPLPFAGWTWPPPEPGFHYSRASTLFAFSHIFLSPTTLKGFIGNLSSIQLTNAPFWSCPLGLEVIAGPDSYTIYPRSLKTSHHFYIVYTVEVSL